MSGSIRAGSFYEDTTMSKVLQWLPKLDEGVRKRMFKEKLTAGFRRPSHLDVIAQTACVISKRSTCLWYEVGAVIFNEDASIVLSTGYNGAARGDVDPRVAGCARVVDGKLAEGQGLCRGSHAELNAIGNLQSGTLGSNLSMMVTLHPCFSCAKQIVNKGIKNVYYLWEYGRDAHVTDYLRRLGVHVELYSSDLFEEWVNLNRYHPIAAFRNENGG